MIQYFITTEPFYDAQTGDYDYVKQFVNHFSKVTKNPIYELTTKNEPELQLKKEVLEHFTKNVANGKKVMKHYDEFYKNPIRKKVIQYFLQIMSQKKEKNTKQILILQYRVPETGIVFYPDDITLFQQHSIDVILVCHEIAINVVRPYLKKIIVKMCNASNLTFFFNHSDYEEAKKVGFNGKYAFTQGLITLDIPYEKLVPTLERPSNILYFGLIRPNKGFLNILEMAELLKKKRVGMKIYVMGKCEIDNPIIKSWIERIKSPVVDSNLKVESVYRDVIEIKLNPTDDEIFRISNLCQYSYKTDGKGFANNASSLINVMALGCILFTKSTLFTDKKLIEKNSPYSSTVFFQNQVSNSFLNNRTPKPEHVLHSILFLNEHPKMKEEIVKKMKQYIHQYHNTKTVIQDFVQNVDSLFPKRKNGKKKILLLKNVVHKE